jgi:DNA-directed RNA polymerase specialized sigma24 family protein
MRDESPAGVRVAAVRTRRLSSVPEPAVAGALALIEGPFLGVARRYSLCDDDASEALARALEIAVRHHERIRPETAAAWFAVVVRHEAIHLRRSRCRELSLEAAEHEPAVEQPAAEREPDPRLPALRAAMRQLKPDQERALLLFSALDASRGDGGRYRHIMRATGWSYTKVNRCLAEGRATLRALLIDEPLAT